MLVVDAVHQVCDLLLQAGTFDSLPLSGSTSAVADFGPVPGPSAWLDTR